MTFFRRLRARDSHAIDVAAAAVLILAAQLDTWFGVSPGAKEVLAPCALVIPAAVAWRARAPLLAIGAAMTAVIVQSIAASPPQAVWAIVVVVLLAYAAGAWPNRIQAAVALAIAVAAMTINESQAADENVGGYVFVGLITILPWVAGRAVHARERAQDETARAAVAAERARIARELHDMVAHAVSIMVVKAEAADAVLARSPDKAHEQLAAVMRTGRDALEEMTRLLGILRADGGPLDLAPQPGLDRLRDLVADVEAAGLQVELETQGAPRPLSPGIDLAAYRVVQEALTNARKHAGPGTTARVCVTYAERELVLEIRDNGREGVNGQSGGHGLIGMRERVALYGGSLETGRVAQGGFAVRAVLPVERAA